jgi:hypothetical protein
VKRKGYTISDLIRRESREPGGQLPCKPGTIFRLCSTGLPDDQVMINKAVARLSEGTIHLSPGKFKINGAIQFNCKNLVVEGAHA